MGYLRWPTGYPPLEDTNDLVAADTEGKGAAANPTDETVATSQKDRVSLSGLRRVEEGNRLQQRVIHFIANAGAFHCSSSHAPVL